MSHGPASGAGEQSAEPNLTPLLDLVLQLVMFFMLIANFAQEDVNEKIKLPIATQAKPLAAKDQDLAFLNVTDAGDVVVKEQVDPLRTPDQIAFYMRQIAKTYPKGEAQAKELIKVVVRADRETKFRDVHKVMTAIKAAGYRHIQLRAQIKG